MVIIAFPSGMINFELHDLTIVLAYHLFERRPIQILNHTSCKFKRNLRKMFGNI